jgi:hypothetical protein
VTIEPLSLDGPSRYIESQNGTTIDVSNDFNRAIFPGQWARIKGTVLVVAVPFTGDQQLWQLQPSSFSLGGYPELDIRKDVVTFVCSFPDDSADPARIKSEIDGIVTSLGNAVMSIARDVATHNTSAPGAIREALNRKKTKAQSALGAVAALGIPIKLRGADATVAAPTKRRESPVRRPSVTNEQFVPEPVLEQKEFEHILGILKSVSMVIERSPSAFVAANEETIRTHCLFQLNGHYEGSATGETFNASGKTDILIRVNDRNIFIAECKVWRGPKSFDDAIEQLLGYLSWRDSKCALLIFNRSKDSSSVRQKMHEIMLARAECRKTLAHGPDVDSRYILVKASDPGKEIQICTMLFDVPVLGASPE